MAIQLSCDCSRIGRLDRRDGQIWWTDGAARPVVRGHADVVALLLDWMDEASIAASDHGGWTALGDAAWRGYAKVAALLLDRMDEASIAATDGFGKTPPHDAAVRGDADVVALLLDLVPRLPRWTMMEGRRCTLRRVEGTRTWSRLEGTLEKMKQDHGRGE